MRTLVMGAGGVGCYFGSLLARAGHPLTLVARPAHAAAVNRYGLRVESAAFNGHVPAHAITAPQEAVDSELVLLCVKSQDTVEAMRTLAPRLRPDALVLSLQNGVDNAERAAAVLGREVVPAVVYVAVEMAGPGHVRHHGRGELVIGPSLRSEPVASLFVAAGIPTTVSATAEAALWEKLIINCAFNALSAIPYLSYGDLVERAGVRTVMRDVIVECLAVARRLGVPVSDAVHCAVDTIARTMPSQRSSTAQDLEAGKPSEIDYLNGYVVRKGEELGIATPANRVLQVLVHLMAERRRQG